ncbi:MAG: radical SAM protein [Myxococcota bacterium]|nr:radical SAM protein [Myxococcota bacterium]
MRYVGKIYRPPSEANAYILQATIGCSWNKCTYCDMYRDKPQFRVRPLEETLADLETAYRRYGPRLSKIFVADGDALILPMSHWEAILNTANRLFPHLKRVSCYAMASNILEKTPEELLRLRELGLKQLYIGPESGDDVVLKRIAKGSTFDDHVEASKKAKAAGMKQSVIFLLGAGGVKRTQEHAEASARLASAMDPDFLSALTLTVVPNTPLARMEKRGKFTLPEVPELLRELHTFIDGLDVKNAIFRTNHASNYLPIGGTLPQDKAKILTVLDMALSGEIPLRSEWMRGL